jgi:AraC family ethanolamine operon transcriptional activator
MNFDHSHKRARDAGEQAASLPDWDQRYEQLSAGRFEGEVDELRVGPVQVFAERANQTVMQAGRVCANRVSDALVRAGQ